MPPSDGVDENEYSLYDSSDTDFVNARKAASGRKQQRLDNECRRLMSSQPGREFIWEILCDCGLHRNPFSTDALSMAFRTGEMNIGLKLEAKIVRLCAADYSKMVVEAQIRERAEQEREKRLKDKKDGRDDN